MPVIEVVGLASKKSRVLPYDEKDLNEILLYWLRGQGVMIASSCDGVGVCKKCGIQEGALTCELTLKTFLERYPDGKVYISYF